MLMLMEKQRPHQGAKGGVGVILSPQLAKRKMKKKLLNGGTSVGETTRFMSISIKLNKLAKTSKKS